MIINLNSLKSWCHETFIINSILKRESHKDKFLILYN